jgi:hypothetical protein
LVGVLCGRADNRVRYYRHRRGNRGYRKGSVFNHLFPAEPLEKAVLKLVQEVLTDIPNLRERVERYIREQMKTTPISDEALDALRQQRDAVRRRTEMIFSNFDEESLADAKAEIERLKAERRRFDEQIAASETAIKAMAVDPAKMADDVVSRVRALSKNFFGADMPTFALRELLGGLVERVEGDMETKEVTVTLSLPPWAFGEDGGLKAVRLVGTSESSASYQTHRVLTLVLAEGECRYVLGRTACYECRRRPAA